MFENRYTCMFTCIHVKFMSKIAGFDLNFLLHFTNEVTFGKNV